MALEQLCHIATVRNTPFVSTLKSVVHHEYANYGDSGERGEIT